MLMVQLVGHVNVPIGYSIGRDLVNEPQLRVKHKDAKKEDCWCTCGKKWGW